MIVLYTNRLEKNVLATRPYSSWLGDHLISEIQQNHCQLNQNRIYHKWTKALFHISMIIQSNTVRQFRITLYLKVKSIYKKYKLSYPMNQTWMDKWWSTQKCIISLYHRTMKCNGTQVFKTIAIILSNTLDIFYNPCCKYDLQITMYI